MRKISTRDAAKFLIVSYQAVDNVTKSTIIREHIQGLKKFYYLPELIEPRINNLGNEQTYTDSEFKKSRG